MSRPINIEVIQEGEDRYVLLTYQNGDVVRRRVETDKKGRRQPRRPQMRLKLPETHKQETDPEI